MTLDDPFCKVCANMPLDAGHGSTRTSVRGSVFTSLRCNTSCAEYVQAFEGTLHRRNCKDVQSQISLGPRFLIERQIIPCTGFYLSRSTKGISYRFEVWTCSSLIYPHLMTKSMSPESVAAETTAAVLVQPNPKTTVTVTLSITECCSLSSPMLRLISF